MMVDSGTPQDRKGSAQAETFPETDSPKSATSSPTPRKLEDFLAKISCEIDVVEGELLEVLSLPDDESNLRKAIALANRQGLLLMDRFQAVETTPDLNKAIERLSYVESGPVCEGIPRGDLVWRLSNLLLRRYSEFHSLEDLNFAIRCMEESRRIQTSDSPNRPHVFRMLSNLYHYRFQRSQAMEDLERAIEVIEGAIETTNSNHRMRASLLHMLSTTLLSRYQRTGNKDDLDLGLTRAKEATSATCPEDPSRQNIFRSMAATYLLRHKDFGLEDDIEQAIHWAEEAIGAPIMNNHIKAESIHALSAALLTRFQRSWVMEDVDRAMSLAQEALSLAPDYDQTNILNTLGGISLARYRATGLALDLDKAIEINNVVISTIPDGHPSRDVYITNLTQLLFQRYNRYGDPEHLKEGTRRIAEVLAVTPLDHPERPWRCYCLAVFLIMRYEYSETLEDLNQAIELNQEALQTSNPTNITRFKISGSLAQAFLFRYHRLKNLEDIESSIRWARETYSGIKLPGNDRANTAESLARSLIHRFKQEKGKEDIMEAKDIIVKELSETPAEFQAHQALYTAIAEIYRTLYEAYNDSEDLEKSIKYMGDSLAARPTDAPDRAIGLYARAEIVMCRYSKNLSPSDFHFMLRDLYEAWNSPLARGMSRVMAATLASRLLISRRRWQEAYGLLDMVVRLLPVVLSSRSITIRGNQEYKMSMIQELAPRCASVAFRLGEEASYCLRILELGRGVIMGTIIDRRSDLSALQSQYPQLYSQYHHVRQVLDAADAETYDKALSNTRATLDNEKIRVERENAVGQFDEIQASIREKPGFEGFQLPPRSDELMKMACDGPIIMVNSTTIRSDAIIVTTNHIRSIPLHELQYDDVRKRMARLVNIVKGDLRTYGERNEEMEELLFWLWESAVKPIIHVLGLRPEAPLQRIWWIGIGLLAMAPFHAAGRHSPRSKLNTMSYAISSYIPTLKALSFARERSLDLKADFRLLLVSMPTTPGHNPLPSAELEVTNIMDSIEKKATSTHLLHPNTSQVLESLPSFSAVHFSCHGISDSQKPSNSHLLLCNGQSVDPLSVEAITNTNLKDAQIAYLSACSTAENASDTIPDESIYIASGFQLAGFSHVLATKWESKDAACQKVAVDFYKNLLRNFPSCAKYQGHGRVGAAFHYAVDKLRRANWEQPIMWAPYIHTGA